VKMDNGRSWVRADLLTATRNALISLGMLQSTAIEVARYLPNRIMRQVIAETMAVKPRAQGRAQ
jgi:hypothetical protein